jgi:hypothetical protein
VGRKCCIHNFLGKWDVIGKKERKKEKSIGESEWKDRSKGNKMQRKIRNREKTSESKNCEALYFNSSFSFL